ncbi:MAG: L-threonylcarbamoyladenylate synthase [Ectothiorhodospiraceae bacterium]|nr:L-threonylcarbamoyladenylate synthase [Ectothiorhodospiraceae bacterium]
MTELVEIHPQNPQPRLIRQVLDVLNAGGVIIYPTDSCYAFGCALGNKEGMERIRRIRGLDDRHNMTLMCRDLSEIATYAKVDNQAYRLIKGLTPGPYTFLLKATHEVPRRLQNPKRKTIGIRVPDHPIVQALLAVENEPLMSTTVQLPGDEHPLADPFEMAERLRGRVDLVVDGGACGIETTTVIDLVGEVPEVLRRGKGPVDWLVS